MSFKLYRDESLSLAGLAERAQLTGHQLSEYFNVQLQVNFSRYVNRHRVQAACELLVEKPELTVLNVAFEVGFNSKSVFNTAFSRETGLSPTEPAPRKNMNREINYTIPYSENKIGRHVPGFWMETLPDTSPVESLQGSQKCDIAIIGGGFTGLSAAYNARKLIPGADVRVVEANICGSGSSGRNAGFSSPLFGMGKAMTAMRFGKENAMAAHQYMLDAVDYLERLIKEQSIECDYERPGSILVASSRAMIKRIEKELSIAESWGLDGVELWDKVKLAKEFKTDFYMRGVFEDHCAVLNPARLARGLMRIAQEAGSIVYEKSPVIRIEEVTNGYRVKTPDGELYSERIVFATNAYSVLFPDLSVKQTPIFQYIVLSEPLTDKQLESIGWQSRVGLEDACNALHYYRLTADNRILMGGGDIVPGFGKKFSYDSNRKVFAHLKKYVTRIYPQLKGLKFSHQWGGPVSIALDQAPVIGYTGRNNRAIYSLGLMGHGVSMAPYNGQCIAELLANQTTKRTEMFFVGRKTTPWPPHIIRYPLLQGIRGLLKLQDKLYN